MSIGVIGSCGKMKRYADFEFTIPYQKSGVDAWTQDATAGDTCYSQIVLAEDINPSLYVDGATDFYVMPNPTVITQSALEQFSYISIADSTSISEGGVTKGAIKFFSMTGKPTFNIPVIIRIIY